MTGPTGPDHPNGPFRGTEFPSLENSGQQPDPFAPVDYPTDAGLPPPVYPPQYPAAPPRISRCTGLPARPRLLPRCGL